MTQQLEPLPSQSKMFNYDQENKNGQKTQKQQKMVSFLQLFRFADKTDKILMFFGTIGAALIGTAMPMFALLWGTMTTAFGQGDDAIVDASRTVMFQFFGIGGGAFFAAWMMYACWMIAGERQAIKCRKQYLKSLLGQQIGWFDQINQSQISSKFSADCFAFQGAIGQKVSLMIQTFAMFIAGFIIAFVKGWRMTLVTLAAIPALAIAGAIYVTAIQTKDKRNAKYYARAGGLAEQAFSSIKTVKQMNGQQFQITQYKRCLEDGSKKGLKFGFFAAIAMGIMSFSMLGAHALGFWYGSNCVEGNSSCPGDRYEPGDVLIVFFSVLMAALNLSQLSPSIKKIAEGKSAAARIFQILDRQTLVKNPQNPKTPTHFVGHIKLENVTFAYPKNKKVNILNDISLQFSAHNTALVGESGCGKSTILQLLMRFYDPDQGAIYLDGINLKQLDLGWLRSKIGYVGQEPVLFAMSIKQNLLFGKENATDEEINEALKQAQALDFVKTLDNGINTFVGSGGGQLSGGQKQRIAISRALLRNPEILLLDEATSALDRKNEKLIQKTLDKISQSRTTISIAHRTKTIMGADIIYVLNKGVIEQKGNFKELKRYKDYVVEQEKQVEQSPQKEHHTKTGRIDFTGETEIQKEAANQAQIKAKQQLAKQEKQKLLEKYKQGIYSRLFKYSQGSQCLLILGFCFSIASGLVYPAFTVFFAKMLKTLFDFSIDPVQARKDADFYALVFTYIAIIGCFVNFFNSSIFSVVGDKITRRVRLQAFSKIVKMPIPWFDLPKNNGGQLTTKLSSDSLMVNGLTATFISILLQNASTLIAGLIIAFIFEWRTALFSVSMLPLMIIVGMISQNRKSGFSDKTDEIYKESSNLIVECMTNIRTVESFGYQDIVLRKYEHKLEQPMRIGIKKGNVSGILFAFSQLIMFFVFGLIFFLGTVFKRDNNLGIDSIFTAIYAIFFSAMTIGNNSHFMPDIEEGKLAAARLFEIIDGEDEDQMQVREQSKLLKTPIQGDIVIEDLSFKYETRNNHVFQNFSHKIQKGNKIAFVGASGCGKSTILQLIQRFYFPEKGRITIDGVDIKDYDIHHLRASLGVVSQQPTLFNGSFKYNIQYNIPNLPMQEIIEVARSANAFSFIMGEEKLQEIKSEKKSKKTGDDSEGNQDAQTSSQNKTGFDRSVGLKGSQISGGQKQRIAIARTILRRPKVLLLDEATSALDSKNEEIVQKALDRIMEGRTTISVAHRIDTIKNSDEIDVFERGRIVESGKYDQLVKRKGYFYNLERGTEFL